MAKILALRGVVAGRGCCFRCPAGAWVGSPWFAELYDGRRRLEDGFDRRSARSDARLAGPVLRLVPGKQFRLSEPTVQQETPAQLKLSYRVSLDADPAFRVVRSIHIQSLPAGLALVESFVLKPSQPLKVDLEIERPFTLEPVAAGPGHVVCPLLNGWAKRETLTSSGVRGEYRLGLRLTAKETPQLALPLVQWADPTQRAGALMSDPYYGALFEVYPADKQVCGSVRYRYRSTQVPLEASETRSFGIWLPSQPSGKVFDQALDAFFDLMLPDVPPGPKWLHQIAMIDYDFLSDHGQGWERDVKQLAQWLKPDERRRVALCLHGWYDALGSYCYEAKTGELKKEWVAFARTQKVRLTQEDLKRRLRLARDLGFRVLLYFGDGLASDSGVPTYRDDWAYRGPDGKKVTGWQGPDTLGTTYLLNPGHPEVFSWFLGYLDALLKTYGGDLDGLVWDETFHARIGQMATQPRPAYCDRALMLLIKELARRVHAFDPEKVFLASDCIGGVFNWEDVPGYGMVAHGTWQDSWCHPSAWSYGLFPNWRNVLWSCNWQPINHFHYTRWGVETFGVPVAISNGWGDDLGPWEWKPRQRDALLKLFRERLQRTERVRYLTEDPAQLVARGPHVSVAGDALPVPAPGLANWTLARHGSRATASSQDAPHWPAAGAIDGVRDETGWGGGHGWASAEGQPLPQWLQVDFRQPRPVALFVVTTYQKEKTEDTAGKWGILDYELQAWDTVTRQWQTLVNESKGQAMKVRVHRLATPFTTEKIRLVVHRVAPLDGRARLLQLEAWGPSGTKTGNQPEGK